MIYKFSDLFFWASGKSVVLENGINPVYGSNGIVGYTNNPKYENKIILGRVGAYCGSVHYCSGVFDATDNTLITTCDTTKIIYEYAYYLFKRYNLNLFSGGSAQPLITQSLLKHLRCDIPPIAFQHKVVEILNAYDKLIEKNNSRIYTMEQMAENLYKEWFVRFRFPGHENAEFENGIPKGWEIERLDSLISFNPTLPIKNGKIIKSVPMEALDEQTMIIDEKAVTVTDSSSGSHFQNNDTLFARITPCLENGKTGFVQCLDDKETATGSTEFIVLRSKTLSPYIVYLIARSYYFRQIAILSMNGADGRQRTSVNKLKSLKYPQPPKEIVDVFSEMVYPIFDRIHLITKQNENLIKQRDLLLPRLMSGKLEV